METPKRKRKSRVKEPSTHAGIAAGIASAITFIPPQYQWIAAAAAAIFSGVSIVIRENGNE